MSHEFLSVFGVGVGRCLKAVSQNLLNKLLALHILPALDNFTLHPDDETLLFIFFHQLFKQLG